MPTLYIDIYFLINFTVDYLSLYFASLILGIKTSLLRLLIPSLLGGLLPCLLILLCINNLFYIPIYILWLIITAAVCPKNSSLVLSIKFVCIFTVIQTLFGGAVGFFFDKLEKYLLPLFGEENLSSENSSIILLSAIIALVYCLLKLFRLILSSSIGKRTAQLKLRIFDTEFTVNGIIDSGNFLKDPMDLTPVIIIKEEILKKYVKVLNFYPITSKENPLSKKLRIIPIKDVSGNRILYGFKPDYLELLVGKRIIAIKSTVAIDTHGGSFNDCDAIIPLSAIT